MKSRGRGGITNRVRTFAGGMIEAALVAGASSSICSCFEVGNDI